MPDKLPRAETDIRKHLNAVRQRLIEDLKKHPLPLLNIPMSDEFLKRFKAIDYIKD